ncbi:MAG: hypothetical protein RLZZ440_18 [Planctomycetota bacterium]
MNAAIPFGLPGATALYLSLYLATFVVHMVFMHYVLAGATYLACGRLMGESRSKACEWQAILLDWLPFATGLAITAGVGPLLFVQMLYGREFATANLLLSHRWMAILPVLIASFYLLYLQKSSWISRRPWVWRPLVALVVWAGFLFIALSWTENHLLMLDHAAWPSIYESGGLRYESPGLLPRLAVWFFLAFPSLAVELAWQGRLTGVGIDAIPQSGPFPARLSPARRLALTAGAGLVGSLAFGLLYWSTLPSAVRAVVAGPLAGPWLVLLGVGVGVQAAVWLIVAIHGRLSSPLLLAGTGGWIVSLVAVALVREAIRVTSVDMATSSASLADAYRTGGLQVFLVFAGLNAAAIVWCIHTVRGTAH